MAVYPPHTRVFRNSVTCCADLKQSSSVCENLTEAVGHVNALHQHLPNHLACWHVTMDVLH
jgi:hypothetical protein